MLRNILIIGLTFLLTACGTTEPLIRVETREVKIPVPVACKTEVPSRPALNVPNLKTTDTVYDKAKAYVADSQLRDGYERELLAALLSCK